jgi:two-component system sensor histidine kinase HydH
MTEDEAQQRHHIERLAQLGSLFAGFAHEIRNPLSTIGLNLQLVQEDFTGAESTRERRTYTRLSVVQGEVKRLQTILDEFLGFVRWPAPQRRDTDLNRLLRSVTDLSTPELKEQGITLKFFAGTAVGEVLVDADQIRAAAVNLLRNAKEACASGDEILLSTKRVGDEVLIQVTDTGPGMSRDVVENAFTPYFSTKKGGTGLGLAIAKRTLEEHGGRLELSSELGKGTQFTLRLPVVADCLGDQAGAGETSDGTEGSA